MTYTSQGNLSEMEIQKRLLEASKQYVRGEITLDKLEETERALTPSRNTSLEDLARELENIKHKSSAK